MKSKVVILCVTGLLLVLGLNGSLNSQPPDLTTKVNYETTDIVIGYYTAYPGTEGTWVEVLMRNPEWVSAFRLNFQMAGFGVARFSCDDTGSCIIDTTGCLANTFSWISCSCGGVGLSIEGSSEGDTLRMIPPRDTFDPLFRFSMDACCIPDADTGRSAYILLPVGFSELLGRNGESLPLDYSPQGEMFVWWSVPGDANGDSVVDIGDVLFLINYLFIEGAEPCVCEAADCNNDSAIDIGDITYLINYLFINGPAPLQGSVSCWHEECWP